MTYQISNLETIYNHEVRLVDIWTREIDTSITFVK